MRVASKLLGKGTGLWQDPARCRPRAVLVGEELIARLGVWPGLEAPGHVSGM